MAMSTPETLSAFSQWLDEQGIIVATEEDNRSHDQLARTFIQEWESNPNTATLAGRSHRVPGGAR